jgi:hypothetical protein
MARGSPGNEKTRTGGPGVLPAVRVFFSRQLMEFRCRVRGGKFLWRGWG